jgi:hypothetical protein
MKIPIKIYILLAILFLTQKVHAGGCWVDERIFLKESISPHDVCLDIQVYVCGNNVVMTVANMCDEPYIYPTKDGNVELLPYKSLLKDKLYERKFPFSFSDKTIPQQFFNTWQRMLYKKNDPNHKIYVNAVSVPAILVGKKRIVIDSKILSWVTKIVPLFKFYGLLY